MKKINRKNFITKAAAVAGGTAFSAVGLKANDFSGESLQVWSCGGLAEAFIPANAEFMKRNGSTINYTGAFAGALGKSLLGSARTEIFAPRVLGLAKKLRAEGKMVKFYPLCFTEYVLATPLGNPAGITGIHDIDKKGVRVVSSPKASPPGGAAVTGIMKKAGVLKGAELNMVQKGDCVQRDVPMLIDGGADVSIIERRVTRLPQFREKLNIIEIPEEYIPAKPVPFVIGIMKWAKNMDFAEEFVKFIISEKGQSYFDRIGFIPACSEKGKRLIEKYGVKDV